MKKLLLTTSVIGLTFGIHSNAVAQSFPARDTIQCLDYKGRVISNSICNTHIDKIGTTPIANTINCSRPVFVDRGDDGGGSYVDVDGDGRGDFSSIAQARAAGFTGNNGIAGNYDIVDTYGRSAAVQNVVRNVRETRASSGGGGGISGAISSIGNAIGNAISSIGNAISRALGGGSSRSSGSNSNSGGGSSSDRVICTYFFLNNEISKDYYYADYEYTLSKIHPNTVKGYHFWAIPYAEKMYKNPEGFLTKLIRPVAINRAEELAYQMGIRSKPNYLGKFFRLLIEPACFCLGIFVQSKDYKKLYTKEYLEYASRKYESYRRELMYKKQMAGTPLASFVA